MTDRKPFGVGSIGCGSYGQSLASALVKSPKLRATACYDPDKKTADAFAEQYQVERCDQIDQLLVRDDVDGVIIASPNNAHRGNVEVATQAGKHVFVDKPISNTLEDALAIIAVAESAGVTLAVGHNGRRLAGHRKMREMLDAGAVGTPVTVEANFSHSGGLGLKKGQWRCSREGCPALPLMQLGVHFADTVQYLLGDVLEVCSFMSHVATPVDNDDVTVSLLKFDKGLLGYLGSNYATPAVYYVNVYGTGGNLYCEGGGHLRYRKAGSRETQVIELTGVDTQVEELEEFARCAQTGEEFEVDGEAGLKALAVVQAALRSNETGSAVRIDELIAEAGRSRA